MGARMQKQHDVLSDQACSMVEHEVNQKTKEGQGQTQEKKAEQS